MRIPGGKPPPQPSPGVPEEGVVPAPETRTELLQPPFGLEGEAVTARAHGAGRLRRRVWSWQAGMAPYLFVLPFVILFCVFMLYPLAWSIWLSLQKTAGPMV